MQEHRSLQLKYHNLHPKEALERIAQEAFTKRKALDVLKYKTKQRSTKLADAKLHLSVLEDRIKYAKILQVFPAEKQAEIITGKVQDAILKKEAALVVHQTYKDILKIMKKVSFLTVKIKVDIMVLGSSLLSSCADGITKRCFRTRKMFNSYNRIGTTCNGIFG